MCVCVCVCVCVIGSHSHFKKIQFKTKRYIKQKYYNFFLFIWKKNLNT
jgi:hypothetical protein